MGLFNFFTQEIAMDLGTANTLIIHNDEVVVNEPSIIALNRNNMKEVLGVGKKALLMHEKTHESIKTVRPLKDGVIADFNAAELMIQMEHKFIDKMFEMGDLENMKAEDLKHFITKRANEKLVELGYEPKFAYNESKAAELDWFYHLTGGHTHTDFFAIRPTDYSKANEGEDFEDIW